MANSNSGGWSDIKDADKVVQKITHEVKAQVEGKTNHKYIEFHAVQYRTQVVAGTNYLIKVHVGINNYLHLLVYQKLPCDGGKAVVTSVQAHHHKTDPLAPF